MINQRLGQERSLQRALGSQVAIGSVRSSDLIRPPQDRETGWTVFVDVNDERPSQRRCVPRDTLTRRRPIEWALEEDEGEANKENVGHVVRRPKRRRLQPPPQITPEHDDDSKASIPKSTPASPSPMLKAVDTETPPSAKNKGKRKLQTPPTKEAKITKKSKKTEVVQVRVEPAQVAIETAVEPMRRPLEDITHLFIDPTAFYFRPWQRASRVAMRASSMRTL